VVLQGRESSVDDAPDDVNIDTEVFVDEDVSESRDAAPGNLWMLSPEIGRQASDRLADELQFSDDRILHHGIRKAMSATASRRPRSACASAAQI
jgi:hypothetical protein